MKGFDILLDNLTSTASTVVNMLPEDISTGETETWTANMRSVSLTGDGEPASNFSNTEVAWTSSSSSSASQIMENMTEEAVALSDILEDDNFTSHLSSSNLDLQTESPPDEASSVMVVETAPGTDIFSEDNLTDTGTDLEPMEAMLTLPMISTSTEGMEEEILATDDDLFSINIDRNTSHSPFAQITESATFVSAESELELAISRVTESWESSEGSASVSSVSSILENITDLGTTDVQLLSLSPAPSSAVTPPSVFSSSSVTAAVMVVSVSTLALLLLALATYLACRVQRRCRCCQQVGERMGENILSR